MGYTVVTRLPFQYEQRLSKYKERMVVRPFNRKSQDYLYGTGKYNGIC